MSSILVPKHVAQQRRAENAQAVAPSVVPVAEGPSALTKDTTLTPEQVRLAISRWDVDPVGQRIFVAPMPRERSSGGIIMSQVDAELSWDGVVIAAGPLAFVNKNTQVTAEELEATIKALPEHSDAFAVAQRLTAYHLEPGDKVTFARWSGETMRRWWLDAPPLKVMNADDVIGMVKE